MAISTILTREPFSRINATIRLKTKRLAPARRRRINATGSRQIQAQSVKRIAGFTIVTASTAAIPEIFETLAFFRTLISVFPSTKQG
jgi:hypothetical protein